MPHLFADISSHGFGHLAQAAPVLNRLAELIPDLHLTVRCGLPLARLQQRLTLTLDHLPTASDFGYVMIDALRIDLATTAQAYRAAHTDFPTRVAAEARLLRELAVDAVFTDVAYLPLAGAAQAGLPAVAMCSLNWADLYAHYFGRESWATPIHAEMLAAYQQATFLRTTPGMPMPALEKVIDLGPVATLGEDRRGELQQKVGAGGTARIVLVALGGIPTELPITDWPVQPETYWLVPAAWRPARADFHTIESCNLPFADLLRSVDAVVTKPGYGTFTEAACNGTAVIYQRREDWPEQDCLIDWLEVNARCTEVSANALVAGDLGAALHHCLASPLPPLPTPKGIDTAAGFLADLLQT